MKSSKLVILLFFFTTTAIFAQTWQYELERSGALNTTLGVTDKTADGNYVLFLNGKITEFSEYGEPVFSYSDPFAWTNNNYPNQAYIKKDIDGYVITYNGPQPTTGLFALGKLGLDGNYIWHKYLTRPFENLINQTTPACATTPNNNLFLAGVDTVYLIDSDNGQIIWQKFLYNDNFVTSMISNNQLLTLTELGEFFILDTAGTVINTHSLSIKPKKIIDTDNNYVIVGENNGDGTLMFFDKATNTTSSLTFGNGVLYDIKTTWDGFIISGSDGQKAFLIKTNEQGVLEWQQFYGSGKAQNVEVSSYDGYVVMINENGAPRFLKTDKDGNTDTDIPEKLIGNFRSIDVSNIRTIFNAGGTMFWNYLQAQFNVPKDTLTSTIFAGGLWLGGVDNNGSLKLAAETYQSEIRKDYWAGPTGVDQDLSQLWDKVWKIKKDELRDFKNDIADGTLSRPIPNDILTWPAIGNPHFKGIIDSLLKINQSLAEFVDVNLDGVYNAYDGDYPVMKGDEMLWWVFNDSTNVNTNTTGEQIGATVIGKAYGYDCSGNSDIYNTLFLEFDIKNDGSTGLNDFFVGLWTDFDLGCYTDDYIGSDPLSDSYYVYNSSPIDNCGFTASYGNNPPVQSVSFLNQNMDYTMYYSNSGVGGFSGTNNPTNPTEYHNYLIGKWKDGTALFSTGNGYQQLSPKANHAFSGNPSSASDWSMCSANMLGADYQAIGSTGPFTFNPNETISVQMAYTFHENIPLPCPDISADVRTNITNVKNAVGSQTLDWIPNLGLDRTIDLNSTITLDPNYSGSTYQWSDNTTGNTLDITAPGVYTVTVTDVNGCQKTDEVNIYAYTDIEEIEKVIDFKAFPNPTSDKINISFETTQNADITFSLVNVIGQTIKIQTINSAQKNLAFDVSELPTGIYFLNARSDNGSIETQKIIIER